MTECALPGWSGAGHIDGVPLWRRTSEPVYVAAADRDQLTFLDAALALFDTAGPREFAEFVERAKNLHPELGPSDQVEMR